jgi:O-acetyl-ADP-ribose deacetylase (regulator of RNase III)
VISELATRGGTILRLVRGNIVQQKMDAIVNAANSSLLGGGGVDGAIHRAGGPAILEECRQIRAARGGCSPGEAVITGAGNLSAKFVIHTVGPVWQGGEAGEAEILSSCYVNSLNLAEQAGARTIAFPAISTGVYRYPHDKAAEVAVTTVTNYCNDHRSQFTEIAFVLFDETALLIYQSVLSRVGKSS